MSKTINVNNYEFHCEEKGSGEKLLLVHGSASDYRTWMHQIDALSAHYHVIAYSRRYHWPNQKINGQADYSMKEHVEDLSAIITHYGNEPVNLIGHSYGALMAIELACSHSKLIRKMILAEPPAIRLYVSNVPKPIEILKLLFTKPRTALSIMKLGATGLGPATKAAQEGDMQSAIALFGKAALGKTTFRSMSPDRKEQAFSNVCAAELTGSGFMPISIRKLKEMALPVLMVTGERSPSVFGNLSQSLEELISSAKTVVISQASHMMHEDNPEEYNAAVFEFLRGKE